MSSHPVSFRVPAALKQRIEAHLAKHPGDSISGLLRRGLERELEVGTARLDPHTPRGKALWRLPLGDFSFAAGEEKVLTIDPQAIPGAVPLTYWILGVMSAGLDDVLCTRLVLEGGPNLVPTGVRLGYWRLHGFETSPLLASPFVSRASRVQMVLLAPSQVEGQLWLAVEPGG